MQELRETSGMTSRLLLTYADRVGGRAAVQRLLAAAECEGREAELMDENTWFSFATKIRLFEAAAEVLDDPEVTRKAAAHALDFSVAEGMKVALRALGSPRVVYQHIVRANNKFTAIHAMELLDLGRGHARIAFADTAGYRVHPLDCAYNQGLLSVIPVLFGMPAARIAHPACAAEGHERCVYEIRWEHVAVTQRSVTGAALLGAVTVAAAALAAPLLLPAAIAACALAGAVVGRRATKDFRSRLRLLERELADKDSTAERFTASLQSLVSELDLEEVLDKIVVNAGAAVGGKDFVLLVEEEGELVCHGSAGVPDASIATIREWAVGHAAVVTEPILVEDVTSVDELASLRDQPRVRVGSLCLAPMISHGTTLGHLVALAPQARTFLPRDVDLVRAYALQAAVALANARHFAIQRALATRDPLTGLLNHREFHESVERELERCRRHGAGIGVALFDLDGFKLVNDGAGHADGDRVLCGVAAAMQEACRASDMAFRIGGDEFALLLPQTGPDETGAVAERVRAAMAGVDARVSASLGTAAWPRDGGSKDVLLAHADAGLYAMKTADRRRRTPGRAFAAAAEDRAVAGALHRERLAMASRLCGKLEGMFDPEHVARTAVAELHHSFDYRLAYVIRVEPDRLQVLAVAGTLTDTHDVPRWSQRLDQGVAARVVRTGAVALVHDTSLDADHIGAELIDPDTDVELRSELAVPLKVGGRVWGVLSIQDTERSAFSSDDVLLVETVGAQVASALHRAELLAELDTAFTATLGVLGQARRPVADLAVRAGVELGLGDAALRDVRYAALLRGAGEDVQLALEPIPSFAMTHRAVRHVAERWDGGGYPDGLTGDSIPLGARIIAGCEALLALVGGTEDRPPRAPDEAIAELRAGAGTRLDPRVVEAVAAAFAASLARTPA